MVIGKAARLRSIGYLMEPKSSLSGDSANLDLIRSVAFLLNSNPSLYETTRHWAWTEYLSNMTLTMNLFYVDVMLGALWTLPLEVQMYLALPFLFVIGRSRPLWVLAGLWLLAVVAGI